MVVGVVLPFYRVKVIFVFVFREDVVARRHNTDGSFFNILTNVEFFISVMILYHADIRIIDALS